MSAELRRLVRFGCVGATNTALTLAVYSALVALGVGPAPASALAFAAGAVNGYHLNRGWTFRARGGTQVAARYAAVQGLGAALSAAGVAVLTRDAGLRHLAAEALVLPAVTLTTYVLARLAVFGPGMRAT